MSIKRFSSFVLLVFSFFTSNCLFANEPAQHRVLAAKEGTIKKIRSIIPEIKEDKTSQVIYEYKDREHTENENLKHIGIMYAASWIIYPLTQPSTVKNEGSWDKYKDNFGELVFDQDEPFWNWFVHPYSGSQLYLYYRSQGYKRTSSVLMTLASSALFEFTIEIYTEPASIQDLYQTPILGSIIGLTFESLSLMFLNSGNFFLKFVGHVLNPMTVTPWTEGKTIVTPTAFKNGGAGLMLSMEF